ncbi:hypothetical protein ACMFMG_003233 [Clarireedia jacksonii]
MKYIALSHRWGDPYLHKAYCTYRSTLEELKAKIDFTTLPKTFQDAVLVTRKLGVRYLWIDSICIIQEDERDWDIERKRMEDVFSSAYCTIAASSASGTNDGFLKPRAPMKCAMLQRPSESTFYIRGFIDDFRSDVELGELNKRGWVFQERALSRRSVYFTNTQMYWECGHGVHCETLTKLTNLKSSFLADPAFPESALGYYKGMKIHFFQHLYEQYSKLNFTRITDRSVGMAGLEKRLARTYRTRGEFGILDEFLHRSLLWQRDGDRPMQKIHYTSNRKVPSWSWMAVEGPMKYTDVPFNSVIWNDEIQFPDNTVHGLDKEIPVIVCTISSLPEQKTTILDRPEETDPRMLKCVLCATEKAPRLMKSEKCYVLLVTPTSNTVDCETFERVGVAILERKHISSDGRKINGRLV